MSLLLNRESFIRVDISGDSPGDKLRESDRLDLYLAIMENNKKSNKFVPDDALLALDMAGYVRDKIAGRQYKPQVSVARLALALAQPMSQMPIQ